MPHTAKAKGAKAKGAKAKGAKTYWPVAASALLVLPCLSLTPVLNNAYAQGAPTADERPLQQASAQLLEENLALWYQRSRPDRMAPVLEQMRRVDPQNPFVLEASLLVALQRGNTDEAATYLARLEQNAPQHPVTERARETFKLETELAAGLSQARLLYLAGQYDAAAEAYRQLFPTPPNRAEFAIDYWQAQSRVGNTQGAIEALQQLRQRQPLNGRVEIALYRLYFSADQLTADHLASLNTLTQDPVFGDEALSFWPRIIDDLPLTTAYYEQVQQLQALHGERLEISSMVARYTNRYNNLQARLNSPGYPAYMSGVEALENDQPEQAERWFQAALQGMTPFTELYGNLGYATLRQGRHQEALEWFRQAQQLAPEAAEWQELQRIARYWLLLQQIDQELEQAEVFLLGNSLDTSSPNDHLEQARTLIAQAAVLQASGAADSVEALLTRRARYHQLAGNQDTALALYQQALAQFPDNQSALWGAYQLRLAAAGDVQTDAVLAWVHGLTDAQQAVIASEVERRQANALVEQGDAALAQGEAATALQLWQQALALNPSDPWTRFHIASAFEDQGDSMAAREIFAPLLNDEGVATSADAAFAYGLILSRQNRFTSALTQVESIDPSAQSDAMVSFAERLQTEQQSIATQQASAQEYRVELAWQHASSSGTPGVTDWQADTLLLALELPQTDAGARWAVYVEPTHVQAGAFDSNNTFWRPRLGSGYFCVLERCGVEGQLDALDDSGVAFGVHRVADNWQFDIGTTPQGFELATWVGGISWNGRADLLGGIGWSVGAERRAITSGILSFAGRQDPFSEARWGAVTRNALTTSLSWDQGGRLGWWAVAGGEYYDGHRVAANHRWYAHQGIYVRAYDTPALAVTLGATQLNWGFDKTLSENTLGHGGYYSPRLYNSISFPLTVFGGNDRISYNMRLSAGYSRTSQHAAEFFPNRSDLQALAEQLSLEQELPAPIYNARRSTGVSYGLNAQLEYRMTASWYLGASLQLQRSETFAPNNGTFYLRYQSAAQATPPRRPPDVPSSYMDF